MICLEPNCQGDRPCAACSDKMLAPVFQGIRAAFLTKAQAEIFLISYNSVKLTMRRQTETELEQLIASVSAVAPTAVAEPQQESLTSTWTATEELPPETMTEGLTPAAVALPAPAPIAIEPEPGAGEPALADAAMAAVQVALAMERGESPPPRQAPAPVPVAEPSPPIAIETRAAPTEPVDVDVSYASDKAVAPDAVPVLAAKPEAATPGEEIDAALLTNGAAHKATLQPKTGKRRVVSTP
jgi:hypothetical protein